MIDAVKSSQDKLAAHPLQSWAWGEFRRKTGVEVCRLSPGWQLTFHKLPFLPWTIGYFPKGPLPSKSMIDKLIKLGKEKRAIFIQLEPNVLRNTKYKIQNTGLVPSHHPLFTKYTFILDLTKSEDELLKSFHPKTRYNIHLAEKYAVIVKEDNSPKAFQQYLKLTLETTGRQKFYAHSPKYHQLMWQEMSASGIAHLFTATYKEATLAAWIVFGWKDTVYYPYGASSREHREVMAPNLMLWEIARWAKRQGYKYFDLWGALGPNPDPKDPWYGFHRFKEGYRPKLVEFVGSWDLVINPILYKIYTYFDTIRWKILKTLR